MYVIVNITGPACLVESPACRHETTAISPIATTTEPVHVPCFSRPLPLLHLGPDNLLVAAAGPDAAGDLDVLAGQARVGGAADRPRDNADAAPACRNNISAGLDRFDLALEAYEGPFRPAGDLIGRAVVVASHRRDDDGFGRRAGRLVPPRRLVADLEAVDVVPVGQGGDFQNALSIHPLSGPTCT